MIRPNRDDTFMGVAELFAERSTCMRASVGVVIVRDNRIISTGYNGAPSGMAHCTDVGCQLDERRPGCQRAVHAEANAIAYAARGGISLQGSTLYTTLSPCVSCAQLIINAGIKSVIYNKLYRDQGGLDLLDAAGVEFNEYEV